MKGLLTKTNPAHAYEVVKRNHLPGGMLGSKDEINFYTKNGWWPDNAGITIEAAFQDWGLAQMASKMGKKKMQRLFQGEQKAGSFVLTRNRNYCFLRIQVRQIRT